MLELFTTKTLACILILSGLAAGLLLLGPAKAMAQDFELTSPSFEHNKRIPSQHSRKGGNLSPALNWTGLPEGTQSLALVCDDPDAPGSRWVHWVIYNIPADLTGLEQGLPDDEVIEGVGTQGKNSWKDIGYDGPQPPSGTHRYYFKLYALDAMLNLEPGLTKRELKDAIDDHVLEETKLMGKYSN